MTPAAQTLLATFRRSYLVPGLLCLLPLAPFASARAQLTDIDCKHVPTRVAARFTTGQVRCANEVTADRMQIWVLRALSERRQLEVATSQVPPPPPYLAFRPAADASALATMRNAATDFLGPTSDWGELHALYKGKVAVFRANMASGAAKHCFSYLHDWQLEVSEKRRMRRWNATRRSIVTWCEVRKTALSDDDIEAFLRDIDFVS